MIVALEGPSGVGKSTVAAALADRGATRVPEVNELFDHPGGDAHEWYLARQCDRWRIAVEREATHDLVVLDGDPLQPLWYNRIAEWLDEPSPFDEPPSSARIAGFYRERMARREIGLPDRYIVLTADEGAIRERADNDPTRRRGNFEYHLRFVGPQRRYFEHIETVDSGRVAFVDAGSKGGTLRAVERTVPDETAERFPVSTLDQLVELLADGGLDGTE